MSDVKVIKIKVIGQGHLTQGSLALTQHHFGRVNYLQHLCRQTIAICLILPVKCPPDDCQLPTRHQTCNWQPSGRLLTASTRHIATVCQINATGQLHKTMKIWKEAYLIPHSLPVLADVFSRMPVIVSSCGILSNTPSLNVADVCRAKHKMIIICVISFKYKIN